MFYFFVKYKKTTFSYQVETQSEKQYYWTGYHYFWLLDSFSRATLYLVTPFRGNPTQGPRDPLLKSP